MFGSLATGSRSSLLISTILSLVLSGVIIAFQIQDIQNFKRTEALKASKELAKKVRLFSSASSYEDDEFIKNLTKILSEQGFIASGLAAIPYTDKVTEMGQLKPQLTFEDAHLNGTKARPQNNNRLIDYYLSSNEIGIQYELILTASMQDINLAYDKKVNTLVQLIAIIALISMGLTYLMINFFIMNPISRINDAISKTLKSPQDAQENFSQLNLIDVFNQQAQSILSIFKSNSTITHHQASMLVKASDQVKIAMMFFDAKGDISHINPACKSLFGYNSLSAFKDELVPDFVTIKTKDGDEETNILKMLGNGPVAVSGSISTRDSSVRAQIIALTLRNENDQPLQHMAIYFNISMIQKKISNLRETIKELELDNTLQSRQEHELRHVLESCLTLLLASDEEAIRQREKEKSSIERFLLEWHDEFTFGDLADITLTHGSLPVIEGDPRPVRAVFRQALFLAYACGKKARTHLVVDCHQRSKGILEFVVASMPRPNNATSSYLDHPPQIEWQLPFAALKAALVRANGELKNFSHDPEQAIVSFTIPLKTTLEDLVAEQRHTSG